MINEYNTNTNSINIEPRFSHVFKSFNFRSETTLEITLFDVDKFTGNVFFKYNNRLKCQTGDCEIKQIIMLDIKDIFSIYNIVEKILDCRNYEDIDNKRVIKLFDSCFIDKDDGNGIIVDNYYESDYGDKFLNIIFYYGNNEVSYEMDYTQMEQFSRMLYYLMIYCGYDISNKAYDGEIADSK